MVSMHAGALRRHPLPPRAAGVAARLPSMPAGVELMRLGAALVLRFDTAHPGVWTDAFRAKVVALLGTCRAEAGTNRIVLTGARLFEADAAAGLPEFTDLLAALSGPGVPVTAAIQGAALGPGLELALACHGRVAARGAHLGFPGIAFGELPANGGAARLAALIEGEVALEMIGFGSIVPAPAALRIGLVEGIADDPVGGAAGLIVPPRGPRARPDFAGLRKAVRRRAPGQAAPLAALKAIEQACTLPFHRAIAETRRLAAALHASDQGAALRHAAGCRVATGQAARERLGWGLLQEAIHLVDEGAAPQAVDLALRGFGFAIPPLAAADIAGIDIVVRTCVDARADAWVRYSPTLDLMLDAGRTGQAAGRGWYRYEGGGSQPFPDPALDDLLAESARAGQRRRRDVGAAEIVARCLSAAVAMAATLRAEGIEGAAIDAMSLALGFPGWRGGLWYYAVGEGRVQAT